MRVLVIEDDDKTAAYIRDSLVEEGHAAEVAADGPSGLGMAEQGGWNVIVADRMLPGLDGLDLVQSLREAGDATPVLFLSALGQVDERIRGLKAGGDDYLTKPFVFAELLARLEVLAKRNHDAPVQTRLKVADLEMDLLNRQVARGGHRIELHQTEFRLLEFLMRRAGTVVTRAMLLEGVWNYHFDPQTNVIDVHISHLRQKVDKGHGTPLIHTIRGVGYVLRAEG
ncbi:MAG: winged helix-turn-helix domain-containing protein [Solirubrobacterales bacterium]